MTEEYNNEQAAYDIYVAAAIQGMCANPAFTNLTATEIASTAAETAEAAIDERRMNTWYRNRFYEKVPDGSVPPEAMAAAVHG